MLLGFVFLGAELAHAEEAVRLRLAAEAPPSAVETPPVAVREADPPAETHPEQPAGETPGALIQQLNETVRRRIDDLRHARQSQVGREMVMRRDDPQAIEIQDAIAELETRIQGKQADLRALYEADDEWLQLQAKVAETESAVHDARRDLVEVIRARQKQEFEQRDNAVQP